jgi:hypothetical protein
MVYSSGMSQLCHLHRVMAGLDPAIHDAFRQVETLHGPSGQARGRPQKSMEPRLGLLRCYLIACGLIGDPVPPVIINGGPQKKNS